jgi:hypothetical protein
MKRKLSKAIIHPKTCLANQIDKTIAEMIPKTEMMQQVFKGDNGSIPILFNKR